MSTKNYRLPTQEEFTTSVIFTCEDCEHLKISEVDKKAVLVCTKSNDMVQANATCDEIQPFNLNTNE